MSKLKLEAGKMYKTADGRVTTALIPYNVYGDHLFQGCLRQLGSRYDESSRSYIWEPSGINYCNPADSLVELYSPFTIDSLGIYITRDGRRVEVIEITSHPEFPVRGRITPPTNATGLWRKDGAFYHSGQPFGCDIVAKEDPRDTDTSWLHFSGTVSSKVPGFSAIPMQSLVRLADTFAYGKKVRQEQGKPYWDATTPDQSILENKEFLIERLNHIIKHSFELIAKLSGQKPNDGRDDAGAIMFGGAVVCASELTKPKGEKG